MSLQVLNDSNIGFTIKVLLKNVGNVGHGTNVLIHLIAFYHSVHCVFSFILLNWCYMLMSKAGGHGDGRVIGARKTKK
jgi:hypothetical protein